MAHGETNRNEELLENDRHSLSFALVPKVSEALWERTLPIGNSVSLAATDRRSGGATTENFPSAALSRLSAPLRFVSLLVAASP